jgi:hypothetical protein
MRGTGNTVLLATSSDRPHPEPDRLNTFSRIVAAWNGVSLVLNGAFHDYATASTDWLDPATWNLKSQPHNAGYAYTDQNGGVESFFQAATGRRFGRGKVAGYVFSGTAATANWLLMIHYSIPEGPAFWVPSIGFTGGVTYGVAKSVVRDLRARFDRGESPPHEDSGDDEEGRPEAEAEEGTEPPSRKLPADTKIASLATAIGMAAFGVSYLLKQLSTPAAAPVAAPPPGRKPPTGYNHHHRPPKPSSRYVVTAASGLNVRSRGSIDAPIQGAFEPGVFVDRIGYRQHTSPDGHTWIYVRGRDSNGVLVTGWVALAFVRRYPPRPGLRPVTVRPGQTMSSIALEHNVSLDVLQRLNADHIPDPSKIFPGDVVYLPNPPEELPDKYRRAAE